MSLAGDRALIAHALSTVAGLKGFKHRPKTSNSGDAWPLIEALENPGSMNLVVTWRIVVTLPTGEQDAMEWFDAMHEEVSDVLNEQIGFVDRIEPGTLATEAGTRNAMILTVRREA